MNQTEAQVLVTYLNRAGLLQALEGQAPVWADALDDVVFSDAQEAARALAKTTARWTTPGDIRVGAAMIRRRRVADAQIPDPPEALDDHDTAGYLQWRRSYISAIGSGLPDVEADRFACLAVRVTRRDQIQAARPVPQLVTQVAADALETQRRMAREHTAALTAARVAQHEDRAA